MDWTIWIIPTLFLFAFGFAMFQEKKWEKILMLLVTYGFMIILVKAVIYYDTISSIPEKTICEVVYDTKDQLGDQRWVLLKVEDKNRPRLVSVSYDELPEGMNRFLKVNKKFYPIDPLAKMVEENQPQ